MPALPRPRAARRWGGGAAVERGRSCALSAEVLQRSPWSAAAAAARGQEGRACLGQQVSSRLFVLKRVCVKAVHVHVHVLSHSVQMDVLQLMAGLAVVALQETPGTESGGRHFTSTAVRAAVAAACSSSWRCLGSCAAALWPDARLKGCSFMTVQPSPSAGWATERFWGVVAQWQWNVGKGGVVSQLSCRAGA